MSNYTFRKSAIEKAQRWEFSDQGLLCSQQGHHDILIPYTKIQKIRLFYHPNNRYRLNNYCCKITLQNQIHYDIYSCTYDGFATFGDQSETYIPFVKELVQKVKAANEDCKMIVGYTAPTYYGNILFVVVALSALFLLFSWMPAGYRNFFIVIKLIVIVYMGIYLAKSIRVNKPGHFEGTEIPDRVLPQLSGAATEDAQDFQRNK